MRRPEDLKDNPIVQRLPETVVLWAQMSSNLPKFLGIDRCAMTKEPPTTDSQAGKRSLGKVSDASEATTSSPLPEEGVQLVRAFLRIKDPQLRRAVVTFAADLAKMEEAKKKQ
jgi:hypothetical protein